MRSVFSAWECLSITRKVVLSTHQFKIQLNLGTTLVQIFVCVDFDWTCTNIVYEDEKVTRMIFDAMVQRAIEKNIKIESEVMLSEDHGDDEYINAIARLRKSKCRAAVMLAHPLVTVRLLVHVHNQSYDGEFLMVENAFSAHSYLLELFKNNARVNSIMEHVFAISPFAGVGTTRFVACMCS